jgi:hypothetical protein
MAFSQIASAADLPLKAHVYAPEQQWIVEDFGLGPN